MGAPCSLRPREHRAWPQQQRLQQRELAVGKRMVEAVDARLGPGVAGLVHDALRIRTAPERVELYDDVASRYYYYSILQSHP